MHIIYNNAADGGTKADDDAWKEEWKILTIIHFDWFCLCALVEYFNDFLSNFRLKFCEENELNKHLNRPTQIL